MRLNSGDDGQVHYREREKGRRRRGKKKTLPIEGHLLGRVALAEKDCAQHFFVRGYGNGTAKDSERRGTMEGGGKRKKNSPLLEQLPCGDSRRWIAALCAI